MGYEWNNTGTRKGNQWIYPRVSSNMAGKFQNWSLIGGKIIDENVGFSSKPLWISDGIPGPWSYPSIGAYIKPKSTLFDAWKLGANSPSRTCLVVKDRPCPLDRKWLTRRIRNLPNFFPLVVLHILHNLEVLSCSGCSVTFSCILWNWVSHGINPTQPLKHPPGSFPDSPRPCHGKPRVEVKLASMKTTKRRMIWCRQDCLIFEDHPTDI